MQKNILLLTQLVAAQQDLFLSDEPRHLAANITANITTPSPVIKTTEPKTLTLKDGNVTAGTFEYWVESRDGEKYFHANCYAGTRETARLANQSVGADFRCNVGLASGELLDWCTQKMIYKGGDQFDMSFQYDGYIEQPKQAPLPFGGRNETVQNCVFEKDKSSAGFNGSTIVPKFNYHKKFNTGDPLDLKL